MRFFTRHATNITHRCTQLYYTYMFDGCCFEIMVRKGISDCHIGKF